MKSNGITIVYYPQDKIYYPQDILEFCKSHFYEDVVCVEGYLLFEKNFSRLVLGDYSITVEDLHTFDNEKIDKAYGHRVRVTGYLKYIVHPNGGIYPRLRANDIKILSDKYDTDNNILQIFQEIDEILKNKKPFGFGNYFISLASNPENLPIRIALISGYNAQVSQDFKNALYSTFTSGKVDNFIQTILYETTLSNDEQLAKKIAEIAKVEEVKAIYILRGGGSEEELSRIGGPETAKIIAELDIPVYLALGHSWDRPNRFLMKVVSDEFHTPSIAGAELGKLLNLIVENRNKEKELKQKEKELKQRDQFFDYELRKLEELQNKFNKTQEQNRLLQEEVRLLKKQKQKFLFLWIATIIIFVLLKIIF